MEFFTTRQLLLAGRGEEASGSSMLGSLCAGGGGGTNTLATRSCFNFEHLFKVQRDGTGVLEVSMVGMGFAFDSVIEF